MVATCGTRSTPGLWLRAAKAVVMLTLVTVPRVADCCTEITSFENVNVTRNDTAITIAWAKPATIIDQTVMLNDTKDAANSWIASKLVAESTFTFAGLIPGRNYLLALFVDCNSTNSSISGTYRTLPPTVIVTISSRNSTAMNVAWAPNIPAVDVDYYTVYLYDTKNAASVKNNDLSSTNTTQVFTDLIPGRLYQASVTAHSGNDFQTSTNVTARTLPPTVNVTIRINSSTAMTVSWAPNIIVDVDYYMVYLDEINNSTAVRIHNLTSTNTAQEFTDLVPGRSYQASVTAHSGNGSQPSSNVTARTLPPTVNVTIRINSSTAMTVSWAPNIIVDVDYYMVYLDEINNSTAVRIHNLTSTNTAQEFTDLVPGRSYQASVTAHSGNGSQPSSNVTARTLPPTVNVTISINSSTAMTVSWAPNIIVDVDYYMVYLDEINNSTAVRIHNLTSTNTAQEFTDLVPGRSYQASVTAHSGNGSQPSSNVTARTLPPTVNVTISINSSTAMTVSWAPNIIVDVDYYMVYLDEINNSTAVRIHNLTSTNTAQEFTDLVPGRSYQASVTAHSGNGSQPSSNVTARTLPPTVNVTIRINSSTAMTVSWAPNIIVDVDYYMVYLDEINNSTAVRIHNLTSTNTAQEFTDLVPGRSYQASVTAHSGNGSQPSSNVTARTLPPTVNVTISINSSTAMTVSWAPNIIVDVDYYMVYLDETNNSTAVRIHNLTSTNTAQEFTDLVPGRSYQASVTAHSGNGSQPSSNVTARTLPPTVNVTISINSTTVMTVSWAPIITVDVDYYMVYFSGRTNEKLKSDSLTTNTTQEFTDLVPVPPTVNVTISINSSTAMTVSWAPNIIVDVDYYIVYLNETSNSTAVRIHNLTSATTPQVFTDLVPGRSYQASVTAHSGNGSQPSANVIARTLPPRVNVTIIIKNSTAMTVSWIPTIPVDVDNYTFYLNETKNSTAVRSYDLSSTNTIQVFTDLIPGRLYQASVTAHSDNNSQPSAIVTERTYPAPVDAFQCFQNTSTNIYCNWSGPIGEFTNLLLRVFEGSNHLQNITISNENLHYVIAYASGSADTFLQSNTTTNKTFTTIEQLKPSTLYTVKIVVIAESLESQSNEVNATTDVAAPPLVSESVTINSMPNTATSSSLTLFFDCSWFATTNGDLKYYTVIIKESVEMTVDKPENKWPLDKYSDYTSGKTMVYQVDDRVYPTECKSQSAIVPVTVGTGASNGGFVDGALKPNTKYRVSFRAYTYIPGARSVRAGSKALFRDTLFSLPFFTLVVFQGTGAVAGGVIGGLLAGAALAAGGFFLYKKRNQLPFGKQTGSNRSGRSSLRTSRYQPAPYNPSPVFATQFEPHVMKLSQDTNYLYSLEFEYLKEKGKNQSKDMAQLPQNARKNRYSNILPYDHNLVPLNKSGGSNYINASFISGYSRTREYIATQGPKEETVADFWQMVWEQNVYTIVMLTGVIEGGREKCAKYWEDDMEPHFQGDLVLRKVSETVLDDWTIRNLQIYTKDAETMEEVRDIRQFHFTAWRDHGVPRDPHIVLKFLEVVRSHANQSPQNSLTLVHCSAGVGRTGTLIGLDVALQQLQKEDKVDVFHITARMREQRMLMVQTEEQYIFLHQCIKEKLKSKDLGGYTNNIYQNL
ncbi:receptor-type tyrosine-protein phosphatase beta-like isoform X2 [Petromyzon marinus]|uniref:receptor-type tyrosine-protein phosphatase beta-like isoform X2 n=1 Tax=Petromyzon marinus TaxID=7757 RepID=UPI003F706223